MADKTTIQLAGLVSAISRADGLRTGALSTILTAMDIESDELQEIFDKATSICEESSGARKAIPLYQGDLIRLATVLQITNFAAFSTGLDDGFEQGFELSTGLTYGNTSDQWHYDIGTHIGACLAVRGSAV